MYFAMSSLVAFMPKSFAKFKSNASWIRFEAAISSRCISFAFSCVNPSLVELKYE